MNFLLTTTPQYDDTGSKVSALSVFHERIEKNLWAIYESTRNKKLMSEGDNIVFYVSARNSGGKIHGLASIDKITKPLRNQRFHSEHGQVEYFISFKDIIIFENTLKFKDILGDMSFCPENLSKWGVVLMGGARRLIDGDFILIKDKCWELNRQNCDEWVGEVANS